MIFGAKTNTDKRRWNVPIVIHVLANTRDKYMWEGKDILLSNMTSMNWNSQFHFQLLLSSIFFCISDIKLSRFSLFCVAAKL